MMHRLAARLAVTRSEAGYSTEAVVVIALLAILALGALALITEAVMNKAESISLN
ncbi:Tfp pilus assembly protein FimT [Nocardiopsis mwathae]|uniref:Tfp pilus assembly protein FimT n=1 Tax=Nocardiopsis mwathae TaxID=1472723 RepID=A0A7X0D7X8_9ACTN|nr:hypothetical protein [Nocardiopsis mwathae]MBB6174948.1 Tfp pilus assembly protein FimT [Nocardiopsis mwathae]